MGLEARAWRAPGAPRFGADGQDDDAVAAVLERGYPLPLEGGVWHTTAFLRRLLLELHDGVTNSTTATSFMIAGDTDALNTCLVQTSAAGEPDFAVMTD